MKAMTLIIGLLFSLHAFAAGADKSAPADPKKIAPGPESIVPPAPQVGTVERPLIPEEEEEGEKTRTREVPEGWIPNYRFPKKNERDLISINVGANLIYPQVSVNFLVAKRVSIGVTGFTFKYQFEGTESEHLGGMLGVSAYSLSDLKGVWVFAGLGFSTAKVRFLDGSAAGNQPSFVLGATVGYRWRWGHFNTGISGGGFYYEQIHVNDFRYRIGVFYPAVLYDIGFSW